MGTWGSGIFDNDDAADWVAELTENGFAAIDRALSAVLDATLIDAEIAAVGLAAVEVVACLNSGNGETSPYTEDVVAWAGGQNGQIPPSLVARATKVLDRVRSVDSELRALWVDHPDWLECVREVELRLVP